MYLPIDALITFLFKIDILQSISNANLYDYRDVATSGGPVNSRMPDVGGKIAPDEGDGRREPLELALSEPPCSTFSLLLAWVAEESNC